MHVPLDVLGDQVNFSWFHDFVRQGLELAKDFGARRDAGRGGSLALGQRFKRIFEADLGYGGAPSLKMGRLGFSDGNG